MSTAAAQATEFYATFTARLDSLDTSISSASTPAGLDAVVHQLIESRGILQSKDLEGHLSNRDRELYEKRLKDIQTSISTKRTSLQASRPDSTPRTGFSFKRSMKPVDPSDTAKQVPSSGIASSPPPEPVASGQTAQKDNYLEHASASNVQVTLQSKRYFSFEDLSNASNGQDGLSLSLSHLTECVLDFRTPSKPILAINATNLQNCVLLLPQVQGSALLTGVKDSYVVLAGCRQFRMHSSSSTWLFLRSSSPVTLEACSGLHITSVADEETNTNFLASDARIPSHVRPEVQDFEAPETGINTTGTKSWQVPDDVKRAVALEGIISVSERARSSTSTSWLQDLHSIQSPYRASDNGILLVFSEPGSEATLEEFHDWYDNEHVPLRTERFPEFRSAARYQVYSSPRTPTDTPSFKSGWAAAYTISSNQIYNEERYSGLRKNRSKREGELLSRVATLDRRIYTTLLDTREERDALRPLTGQEITAQAHSVYYIGFNVPVDQTEAAVKQWFKGAFSSSTTSYRARLVTLVDALINGKLAAPSNGDAQGVGKYGVYVELGTEDVPGDEIPRIMQSIQAIGPRDVEVRLMRIYRGWDPIRALEASKQ